MGRRDLIETALRVLQACSSGSRPQHNDAAILREHARPTHEAALPLDELACVIINRECRVEIAESTQDRQEVGKRANKSVKRKNHRKIA